MPKTVKFFLLAIFLITALFASPFFSLPNSAQRQGPVATTAASRNAGLVVAADSGAVARPLGSAQQDPVAIKAARNSALVAATQEVLKETSEVRQLSILRPVRSSAQSRAEIERMIMKNLNEETTPAQIHAIEVTWKKMGLAPPDFQYRALIIRLLTEQVAGYYDPKTREFHLADWIDLDAQRSIMAHELTHALQDQHFNLRRFEHWPKGDSDAELAAHALIEGDAMLAMSLYVLKDPLRALALLKSLGTASMSSVEFEKAPRAVRESLLFPYQEGLAWTNALYRRGGWNEVSQAFTSLPQSTEQIMHPEKYFAHEAPVRVTLPDVTSLLNAGSASVNSGRWAVGSRQMSEITGQWAVGGKQAAAVGTQPVAGSADVSPFVLQATASAGSADVSSAFARYSSLITHHSSLSSSAPPSWKRLDYDVQGEWGFYLILDQFLKSPAESRRAAAGWAGDRCAVYEGPKGEVLIASLSTWDTENDAREFFEAYVKRTGLRYPDATSLDAVPNTHTGTPSKAFRTSEGTVVIELRGSRVVILEDVPDRADLKTLLKTLWQ